MARGCKNFLHLEEEYYPDHTCLTTGIAPCDVCQNTELVPKLEAEIATLRSSLLKCGTEFDVFRRQYIDRLAKAKNALEKIAAMGGGFYDHEWVETADEALRYIAEKTRGEHGGTP